jgi:hypothetical protein
MDGSFLRVAMPDSSVMTRGIAVDAFDQVWVAAHSMDGYLFGFNADDGSDIRGYTTGGQTPVGVAVDYHNFIWAINQTTSNASRLDPVTGTVDVFPVGMQPYTYSDFTGFQRARVWASGSWRTVFERCEDLPAETEGEWGRLVYDVEAPASTSIEIEGRTADTRGALGTAQIVTLAEIPGTTPPVEIEAAFTAAGITTGRFLEVIVTLRSGGGATTPVFRSLEVSWSCDTGPLE